MCFITKVLNAIFRQLPERFTLAFLSGDLEEIKTLFSSSREWCRTRNSYGRTIFQEAIRQNKKEIFDYMLRHQDVADLEVQNANGETALEFTLSHNNSNHELQEYFALELIKNGACIYAGKLLHMCVKNRLTRVCEVLLKRGLDANQRDREGHSPLQKIATAGRYMEGDDEIIGMLLYYGAITTFAPSKELCAGINYFIPRTLFDVVVMQEYPMDVCETVFLHTFDNLAPQKISIQTLLHLAQTNSPFFLRLAKVSVDCVVQPYPVHIFDKFWPLNQENLQVFFKKYNTIYCEKEKGGLTKMTLENYLMEVLLNYLQLNIRPESYFISSMEPSVEPTLEQFATPYPYYSFIDLDHFFAHLQFLIALSPKMEKFVAEFLSGLEIENVFKDVTYKYQNRRSKASELLMYMMQHGLPYNRRCAHVLYSSWGYCELFKWFLFAGECESPKIPIPVAYPCFVWYVDGVEQHHDYPDEQEWTIPDDRTNDLPINVIVFLCFNVHTHLEDIFENPTLCTNLLETEQLLDFTAHPKLTSFLLKCNEKRPYKEEVLTRIANRQCLPLLVEMARNVLRKHLVEKFNVQTARNFHNVVKSLPISSIHKDIISFGYPLYED